MGCASSKLFRKDLRREIVPGAGRSSDHVVSLTSSTYGVLKLDEEQPQPLEEPRREDPPEVINAWELMEGLEEEIPVCFESKKSPKARVFLRDLDARSPLKFFNQMVSPKKVKRFGGKENNCTPKQAPNSWKTPPSLRRFSKGSETVLKCKNSRTDSCGLVKRRSLGRLFDPDLVASFEKEISEEEEEQIKKMVSETPKNRNRRNSRDCESILEVFDKNCPPGGENAAVIYTTTLRGIRKTFEDCNRVRSIVESHCIRVLERDVSMDSGFKEELRGLMGTKEVKVPALFVKGRLIGGGADEVVRLEEEGKLGILFDGIPRAAAGCDGCAGFRFVMCMECSGSCKVLDSRDGKKTVRCGECNENGLIQCPICC
ncbi:uncharacterized protein At3g28850-like [Diospyros lotus]|uniref:uncharacterized protein At3g28850-like n=1 Tax=Diospyros lotus TaxID=55363 RepID=UPI0022581141|nr:uncharacterized protein At3g28850-like [Diospyros lotus]